PGAGPPPAERAPGAPAGQAARRLGGRADPGRRRAAGRAPRPGERQPHRAACLPGPEPAGRRAVRPRRPRVRPANPPGPGPRGTMTPPPEAFEIPVALVRDYEQINRELTIALDLGRRLVRLTQVEGQRLLASGLRGGWEAVVEVVGNAGPEL